MKVKDPASGKEIPLPGTLRPENNPGYRMTPPDGASRCWADFDNMNSGCGKDGLEEYAGLCSCHAREIFGPRPR